MALRPHRAAWKLIPLLVVVLAGVLSAPAFAGPIGSPHQVSFTDPLDNASFDSRESAIAYGQGRSLIVWQQHLNVAVRGDNGFPTVIMGRFVDGSGTTIGAPFQISDSHSLRSHSVLADVAYDSSRNRFLVVWETDDNAEENGNRGGDPSAIIRGAIVGAAGDVEPSVNLTPEGEGYHDPAVAYGASDRFLVVFGDVNGEVRGRLVAAEDLALLDTITAVSGPDFAASKNEDGPLPDVAFAPDRWLVVWNGVEHHDTRGQPIPLPDPTLEIYGRSFDADMNGSDVQRISHTSSAGFDGDLTSREPAVAGDTSGGDFLVAYVGQPDPPQIPVPPRMTAPEGEQTAGEGEEQVTPPEEQTTPPIEGENETQQEIVAETAQAEGTGEGEGVLEGQEQLPVERTFQTPPEEIFARRVSNDGTPDGDAQQVSDTNEEEFDTRGARRPDVAHDLNADEFLVTWAQNIKEQITRIDGSIEYEVFGKRVSGDGSTLEDSDQQISNHNDDGDADFDGDLPAVTYDAEACDYVATWTGEEFQDGGDEKEEIWNRPYDAPGCSRDDDDDRSSSATPPTEVAAESLAPAQCASRRKFPIHLVKRRGREYRLALIKVNGQPVEVRYGDRVIADVNLQGLPLGRFSVEIQVTLKNGRKLKGVRRYFTCTQKLPPSNGLERPGAL